MLILKHDRNAPTSSEITPESHYFNRRQFMQGASALGAGAAVSTSLILPNHAEAAALPYATFTERPDAPNYLKKKIAGRKRALVNPTGEELTPYKDVTTYNNFYEFGTDKADPAANAGTIKVSPWSVQIGGLCEKPGTYSLEDILAPHTLEDRIYRFRCVEAWSMVVPWLGFPLADLIRRFQPKSTAKYIQFHTLLDPKQLPGQTGNALDWPYVEGLRMDEAMNPLTLMAMGLYGRSLPDQNGAPLRLIVPWKYGFKSIKSIVRITFTDRAPVSTWQKLAPSEYGFFANVNPTVDHPRWTQATERRLPSTLFNPNRRKTLMFNGYSTEVASMYKDMDLKRLF
jgi:methionine sulfoxide reductase catalytic subunit